MAPAQGAHFGHPPDAPYHLAALALVLLAVLPRQSRVPAPALLRAERQTRIYTAHPGRVAEILVRQGQSVAAGEQLLRLASPDLEHSIAT